MDPMSLLTKILVALIASIAMALVGGTDMLPGLGGQKKPQGTEQTVPQIPQTGPAAPGTQNTPASTELLEQNGQKKPPVTEKNGTLAVGNQDLPARSAREQFDKTLPVDTSFLSDEMRKKLNLDKTATPPLSGQKQIDILADNTGMTDETRNAVLLNNTETTR